MRGILIAAAVLAALWLLERALRAHTKKKFKPAGQFVDVNGRKMHVRVYGEGTRTIVFLPGLGTASPDADAAADGVSLRGAGAARLRLFRRYGHAAHG